MKYTEIVKGLDPNKVYERGFITQEEAKLLKEQGSGKINLVADDGGTEGIWSMLISKEDADLFGDDSSVGKEINVILANHALCFFPNPSWGRVITGKTNGQSRPVFQGKDQIDQFIRTHEAYTKEYANILAVEDKNEEEHE
jgi:hypothetical protein